MRECRPDDSHYNGQTTMPHVTPPTPADNAGWLQKMLMWDFNKHALDGYPGWEIERENSPAFVRLSHVRGKGAVESNALCEAWDDVARARFYQRDWTDDGIPFVREGETYRSGWWFQTLAERDRFVEWLRTQRGWAAHTE